MPTSGTEKVPEISEEAVEAGLKPVAPYLGGWANGSEEQETRRRVRLVLQAAYPAIRQQVLAEVKEGLLGEEAVEAVARVCHGGPQESFDYVDGEDREFALEGARRIAEAALATLTPEEEK